MLTWRDFLPQQLTLSTRLLYHVPSSYVIFPVGGKQDSEDSAGLRCNICCAKLSTVSVFGKKAHSFGREMSSEAISVHDCINVNHQEVKNLRWLETYCDVPKSPTKKNITDISHWGSSENFSALHQSRLKTSLPPQSISNEEFWRWKEYCVRYFWAACKTAKPNLSTLQFRGTRQQHYHLSRMQTQSQHSCVGNSRSFGSKNHIFN